MNFVQSRHFIDLTISNDISFHKATPGDLVFARVTYELADPTAPCTAHYKSGRNSAAWNDAACSYCDLSHLALLLRVWVVRETRNSKLVISGSSAPLYGSFVPMAKDKLYFVA